MFRFAPSLHPPDCWRALRNVICLLLKGRNAHTHTRTHRKTSFFQGHCHSQPGWMCPACYLELSLFYSRGYNDTVLNAPVEKVLEENNPTNASDIIILHVNINLWSEDTQIRSPSRRGWHLWLHFSTNIPAGKHRAGQTALSSRLIFNACARNADSFTPSHPSLQWM